MKTILIATHNAHKIEEIRAILGGQFQFLTLTDFPRAPKVVEEEKTFAGNAMKKTLELARWLQPSGFQIPGSGFFVLADDSGLEVDALLGAPGVHSARFAAIDSGKNENASAAANNRKLLRLLETVPPGKRAARFRCVLAFAPVFEKANENASPVCGADETEWRTELFEGVCEGKIISEPRGKNGFGYDPLFVPGGFEQTFAELGEDIKNKLSHRAKALEKLKTFVGAA